MTTPRPVPMASSSWCSSATAVGSARTELARTIGTSSSDTRFAPASASAFSGRARPASVSFARSNATRRSRSSSVAFVKTGWCDPLVEERALELAHLVELDLLARRHTDELVRLVARFEQERARSIARHELAREGLWREGAVRDADEGSGTSAREQRREPS